MKHYILLTVLVLFSCDVSKLSETKIVSLSKVKAVIIIQDSFNDTTLNSVRVKLTDGKQQIINKDIKILLNDVPLDLYVKNDLYYTKTSYYRTDSLTRKDSYYFEIQLPNSNIKYPLAFIKPRSVHKSTHFSIPEKSHVHEDVIFKWDNLYQPHFVEVTKGIQLNKKSTENITYHKFKKRRVDTLSDTTGTYLIPKSFLTDSLSTTNYLGIKISREERGLLHPYLLTNSAITYNYTIHKTIAVDN